MYIAIRTGQLAALRIADGATVWSVECPTSAAPAAGDGLVYVGNDDLIEARAQADGRSQWRRPIKGRVTSLYWDAGWLIAAPETGPILALRATDGEILWQRDFGAGLSGAPPSLAGDRVYLALDDGRIQALSLHTGDIIWTQTLDEPASGILPVGDRVFVGSRDNHFHSLDHSDGDSDWRWPTGADVLGLPVLDDRRVYFIALDNVLRGHDRNNGSMMWKRVLPMRPATGPILSDKTLIASGVAAELQAYSTDDGRPIGKYVATGAQNEEMLLAAPPHLTRDDVLILITRGGRVLAVGSAPPPAEGTPAPPALPTADVPAPAGATAPDAAAATPVAP